MKSGPSLPCIAAAACAVVLVVYRFPELPGPAWLIPFAIVALLALERPATRWLLLVLAVGCWSVVNAHMRLAERLPDDATGRDFAVTGWVDSFPAGEPARKTFSFVVEHAEDPLVPRRLRLGWYDAPESLRAGESFALTVRLRAPRGLSNPGGFDYEQWLLVQGYGATGYVRAGEAITAAPGVAQRWLRVRRDAAARLVSLVDDPEAAALLVALSIGERFAFTETHWTALRRSGTSHLVAISGMHVGLVATFVFVAVRRSWLLLPHRLVHWDLEAAAAASASAAIAYAALAGFGLPTQRAVVMVLVALACVVRRRNAAWGNGLAVALLIVLAIDPLAVLAASFWLSFGAVGLLLALASRQNVRADAPSRWRRGRRAGAAIAMLQLSIGLGLIPITALHFGEVSIVAPLVNVVAIPYFSVVLVPATLGSLALAALDAPGAGAAAALAAQLASFAWAGIDAAGAPSWAAVALPPPAESALALALLGVVAGLPAHALPGRSLALCALLPIIVPAAERPALGSLRVTVLDVGHGLAVIVETARRRLLYDAGPRFPSGFDIGEDVAVPVLRQRPGMLDLLVLSHADNDHAGGARAVLAAYPKADVLKGPDVTDLPGRTCTTGMRWHWDGVHFEVLHPTESFRPLGNESSCVLKVTAAGGTLLLLGDAERRGEREVAAHPRAAADVVVVGHHGSATSSTPVLVSTVGAELALVSAGYKNRWSFPRADVVERWETAGALLRSTGDAGALHVEIGARGIELAAERERRRRWWRAR